MNIESKDLRAWLGFDNGATFDAGGYTWTATGSPTTSAMHAFNDKALQLNGSAYLRTNGYRQAPSQYDPSVLVNAEVIDWSGNWTIDFWLYLDPSSPSVSRILAVTNSYYGNTYFNVRTNGRRLELWVNTGSELAANVNSGSTIINNATIPTDRPCHVALTYNRSPGSGYYSKMTLYVNGVGVSTADSSKTGSKVYDVNKYATPKQHSEVWVGAKWGDGSQGMVGAIDELRIRKGLVWTADFSGGLPTADDYRWEVFADTERDVYPKHAELTLDAMRRLRDATAWRYENIGTTDGLLDTTTAVHLTGLPGTMSTTGEAFCQTGRSAKLFDVPDATEYWVRFDMYHADMDTVFCGDYLGNDPGNWSSARAGLDSYGDSYNEQAVNAIVGDNGTYMYTYALEYGRLESFIVHLKAGADADADDDADDGVVEVYVNPQGRDLGEGMTNPVVCTGNVNDGNTLAHLTLATERSFVPHEDPETEEEVCPNLFSNIVISNQPLWWDDNASVAVDVELAVDAERRVGGVVRQAYHMERRVGAGVGVTLDTQRALSNNGVHVLAIAVDAVRLTRVPGTMWRYENIGQVSGLLPVGTEPIQLTDLPREQTRTGVAFCQPHYGYANYELNLFKGARVPSPEVWAKLDVYRTAEGSWAFLVNTRADLGGGYYTDVYTDVGASDDRLSLKYALNEISVDNYALLDHGTSTPGVLQTLVVHLRASGAEHGVIEVFTADGGLVYSRGGKLHDGMQFEAYGTYGSTVNIGDQLTDGTVTWVAGRWLTRDASTAYAEGDQCYATALAGTLHLECTTPGTTGAGSLTIPSGTAAGDQLTDGTVVWTVVEAAERVPSTTYAWGDRVLSSDLAGATTVTRPYLECVAAGTTGAGGLDVNQHCTRISNVVLSNQPLWWDDDAALNKPVDLELDAERVVSKVEELTYVLDRHVHDWTADVEQALDTERVVHRVEVQALDAWRALSADADLAMDAERLLLGGVYTAAFAAQRVVKVKAVLPLDTRRSVGRVYVQALDTERDVIRREVLNLDAVRKLPYHVAIPVQDPTTPPVVIPVAPNEAGLQSISILLGEQQVTDQVSFVHAGRCGIMEQVTGSYLDYVFDLRIEETTDQGVLQTCSCCTDVDELLYSQIAYTVPPEKYEWSEDYLESLGIIRQKDPEVVAQPSTTVEEHLRIVAEALGKRLTYRGVKYFSTSNVDEHGGKTYASLITELVGWSARLPHMEINVFIRGGDLYAVQRGYEANTVSLAGAKIANLKVNKKLVRTVWGTDVKSESTVDTYPFNWSEFIQEGYTPSGGGTTLDDEDLVETKTTETETEMNVTTYYYELDERGGKYLSQEVTVKYERGGTGDSWNYVDTITTNHEKVSSTQAHISSVDGDGGILGETVSPSRFEDRATPYDRSHGYGDFVVLHDRAGNQYKVYAIARHAEKREKGTRTVYGLSLVDTSFPLYGDDVLAYLTQQLQWLNRRTEETVTMDVYDLNHVVGFDDKVVFNGAVYHLKSNNVLKNERTVNKQSLTLVRWY